MGKNNKGRFLKVRTNMLWQLVYQVVNLGLGLILPRFIIVAYGSEINGLTSTIKQIIMLATLANAGISTAATYTLYKPIEENNRIKIAEILKGILMAFRRVGWITIILGTAGSIILAISKEGEIAARYIFFACFMTTLQTALGFFCGSICQVFFTATQERHVISIGLLIMCVVTYGGELILSLAKVHFIWLYVCGMVGRVAQLLFVRWLFEKRYKRFALQEGEKIQSERFKLSGMGYATANEIAHMVVVSSQTIIVSFMYGLAEASVFSVYMMVVNALSLIAQVVYSSFAPSYGSIVAEGNIDRTNRVFEIFQFVLVMLTVFMYMCAIYLMIPFVKLYTVGVTDINYTNYLMMTAVILYGFFYCIRVPYNIAVSSNGLFKQSGIQTSITAVISIAVSVIAAKMDYSLVLAGSILFYAVNTFYQHFMLQKNIEGFVCKQFWRHMVVALVCMVLATGAMIMFPCTEWIHSFGAWILCGIIIAGVFAVLLLITMWLFDRKSLMRTANYFVSKIRS